MKVQNPIILEKGTWKPQNVVIHQIIKERDAISIFSLDKEAIEANWNEILEKNPKAFAGPTVRLVNNHTVGEKLILEVLSSDYREGCVLNWLGVAMVPVTSDDFIAVQTPVAAIAATIGGGIRVPGCTPPHADFFPHIIKEMKEEFNVDITEEQLTVLGLLRVKPPLAKYHHGLVVKVSLKETMEELKAKWQTAQDKWEGNLLPLNLRDREEIKKITSEMSPISRLIVNLIIETEDYKYYSELYDGR